MISLTRLPAEWWQGVFVPLEASVNEVLRFDPVVLRHIASQQGRVIAYVIDGWPTIQVRLLDTGVALSIHNETVADVSLHGRVRDFIELASADDKAHTLMHSGIELHGDTELALLLAKSIQQLDVDWEAMISPILGGVLAHQLGRGVRGLMSWGRDVLRTNRVAVRDYLYDETALLAAPELQQDFAEQVDELRFASDRLEARFHRLQQALRNKE